MRVLFNAMHSSLARFYLMQTHNKWISFVFIFLYLCKKILLNYFWFFFNIREKKENNTIYLIYYKSVWGEMGSCFPSKRVFLFFHYNTKMTSYDRYIYVTHSTPATLSPLHLQRSIVFSFLPLQLDYILSSSKSICLSTL